MQLGHVTSEQAYTPALAKMKARAMVLKTFPLDQLEKAELYKIWVQPVINLTARGYEPDAGVLSVMNVVFKTALGVTSRGLAPNVVAEVRHGGGVQTQPLPVYGSFVFAQLWVSFVKNCKQYQGLWVADCVRWVAEVGLSLAPDFLPFCPLVGIVRGVRSLLQRACKCDSQLRRGALAAPQIGQASTMPVWHNIFFRNAKLHLY